jgi:hypothetical protein
VLEAKAADRTSKVAPAATSVVMFDAVCAPSGWVAVSHPLHAAPAVDVPLLAVLGAAAVASAGLTGLALAAFVRRRSRSYLLVALAVATLLARTAVAVASVTRVVGPSAHHLLEHGLDVAMAALVIAAVYYARAVDNDSGGGRNHENP